MAQNMVVKSNRLVESSYRLSLSEQRVLLYCINQIKSRHPIEEGRIDFRINGADLQKIMGVKDGSPLRRTLKSVASSLMKKQLEKPYKENGWQLCQWVTRSSYSPEEGLTLRFSEETLSLLTDISKDFTEMRLSALLNLKSSSSVRIYEMLMQWKITQTLKISVDELQKRLAYTKRKRFADFHREVVKRAITEINKNSDIDVEYTLKKRGRVVTDFVFIYKEKKTIESLRIADKPKRIKLFPFPLSENDYSPAQTTFSLYDKYSKGFQNYYDFAKKINSFSAKKKREIEEEEAVRMTR